MKRFISAIGAIATAFQLNVVNAQSVVKIPGVTNEGDRLVLLNSESLAKTTENDVIFQYLLVDKNGKTIRENIAYTLCDQADYYMVYRSPGALLIKADSATAKSLILAACVNRTDY